MLEQEVDPVAEEVYRNWKTLLLKKDHVVIAEEPPRFISVRQGSI